MNLQSFLDQFAPVPCEQILLPPWNSYPWPPFEARAAWPRGCTLLPGSWTSFHPLSIAAVISHSPCQGGLGCSIPLLSFLWSPLSPQWQGCVCLRMCFPLFSLLLSCFTLYLQGILCRANRQRKWSCSWIRNCCWVPRKQELSCKHLWRNLKSAQFSRWLITLCPDTYLKRGALSNEQETSLCFFGSE